MPPPNPPPPSPCATVGLPSSPPPSPPPPSPNPLYRRVLRCRRTAAAASRAAAESPMPPPAPPLPSPSPPLSPPLSIFVAQPFCRRHQRFYLMHTLCKDWSSSSGQRRHMKGASSAARPSGATSGACTGQARRQASSCRATFCWPRITGHAVVATRWCSSCVRTCADGVTRRGRSTASLLATSMSCCSPGITPPSMPALSASILMKL